MNWQELSFTIYHRPKGQARPRFRHVTKDGKGFTLVYKDRQQRLADQQILHLIMPYKPERPISGPINLTIHTYLPVPKSWSRKKREAALAGEIEPITKPDASNLAKTFEDVANGIFWVDDSQITSLTSIKTYGEPPRTTITLVYCDDGAKQKAAIRFFPAEK